MNHGFLLEVGLRRENMLSATFTLMLPYVTLEGENKEIKKINADLVFKNFLQRHLPKYSKKIIT
jgi:hypothetical protein